MSNYNFIELDNKLFEATREAWGSVLQLEDLPFSPFGYESFLDSIGRGLADSNTARDMKYYAVVRKGDNFAAAIFVLAYALPKLPDAWIKVLSARTSPRLDSRWESEGEITYSDRLLKVASILVSGLIAIYELSQSDLPCKKIKIWANNQIDKALYVKFVEELNSADSGLPDIQMDNHHNWLVCHTT